VAKPIGSELSSEPDEPATSGGTRLKIWRAGAGMAAAVALASLMVAGSFSRQLARRDSRTRRTIAELRSRVRVLQHDVATAEEQAATLRARLDSQLQLTRTLTASDASTIHLAAQPPAPRSSGVVTISASIGSAALRVSGLPALPPDKVYELWWIGKRSGPIKAGVFTLDARGEATTMPPPPPINDRLLASAVTIEPLGGVPKPTGALYLKGVVTN
jgi:anti-sigma-K factor RskA